MYSSYRYGKKVLHFWRWVVLQFIKDNCLSRAASLTYTSLLALVPLSVVAFSAFRFSPFFDQLSGRVQSFIFSNFVPTTGQIVQQYLNQFTKQAMQLPILSSLFLIVTAIMMMVSVEKTLNDLWQVKYRRLLRSSILLYWAMLTLGPLFLGASLLASTYLTSLDWLVQVSPHIKKLELILPFIFTVLAFNFLYMAVPHCSVKFRYAGIGALIAAVLFEISKHIFAYYVLYFSTYSYLYGALAVVPIFLIWIYCAWAIFLFGAEVVNGLRLHQAERSIQVTYPFFLAFEVIGHLHQAQKRAESLSLSQLLDLEPHSAVLAMKEVLQNLVEQKLVYSFGEDCYVLSCDLHRFSLQDLYHAGEWYLPKQIDLRHDGWADKLNHVLQSVDIQHQSSMSIKMIELYDN